MASTAMRTGLRRGALRLDLDDLAAAERAAVRTRLVWRLRVLALRTRHEILRLQRQMATPLALRCARDAFLGMTSQRFCSPFIGATDRGGEAAPRPNEGLRGHCMGQDDPTCSPDATRAPRGNRGAPRAWRGARRPLPRADAAVD